MARAGVEPAASLVLSEGGLPIAYRARGDLGGSRTHNAPAIEPLCPLAYQVPPLPEPVTIHPDALPRSGSGSRLHLNTHAGQPLFAESRLETGCETVDAKGIEPVNQLRGTDLNRRHPGSEPGVLPLNYPAVEQ